MSKPFLLALFVAFALAARPSIARAHGDGKPGPHGGIIRMPGAFHTEVVPGKAGGFDVYVLDVSFANPTTKDVSLGVHFQPGKGAAVGVECSPSGDHFACKLPKGAVHGELVVHAKRGGAEGAPASYPVPLVVPKETDKPRTVPKGADGHHHDH